ncbi:MAG: hypothetical protein KAI17_15320, partial [Thiotrichaceae bacterium]|nr:hypothetical protein [Thiotrichaceae bacterium]
MKSQTLIGLAAVTMVGLSACSQTKKSPQNSSTSSKTYYVGTQEAVPKHIVFRQQVRPENVAHQQESIFQQVSESQVRPAGQNPAQVDNVELYAIGDQIFKNETGGKIEQLVHWNHREDFASMGIGHFTWYPAGRRARYGNTFPGLLDYLQKNGVQL